MSDLHWRADKQVRPRQNIAANHFSLPPEPTCDWLAECRPGGHLTYAKTGLRNSKTNLFNNAPLMPCGPDGKNGTITYVFGSARVASYSRRD
jgi:hypothetical protein